MIFKKITENKKENSKPPARLQTNRYCSRPAVTVAKPPLKTAQG